MYENFMSCNINLARQQFKFIIIVIIYYYLIYLKLLI